MPVLLYNRPSITQLNNVSKCVGLRDRTCAWALGLANSVGGMFSDNYLHTLRSAPADWFNAVSLRLSLHYYSSAECLVSEELCAAAAMHVLTLALCEIFGQYLALL